jgi:hypothetical protein
MKKNIVNFTLCIAMLLTMLSCKEDNMKKQEEREEAKAGKIYNPEQQGIDHENRDNQFSQSRNDNKEGTGQETGAPSDTTTVDDQQTN